MRTTIHILPTKDYLSRLLHDSRFWAVLGIIGFVALFTALVIWAASSGAGTTNITQPYYWPYGPYGPGSYPVHMP